MTVYCPAPSADSPGGVAAQALAGVAKSVDATDLNTLSALRETEDVELLKFGEPCEMAIPSQARPRREGVETRRAAPTAGC